MVIRSFQSSDVPIILTMYQAAFAGYPWFENLSDEVVRNRWQNNSLQPGFRCLVATIDGVPVGAIWWDKPTLASLISERGQVLGDFVWGRYPDESLIWEREVITDPSYQGRGIAAALRIEFLRQVADAYRPFVVLTRMRDDNLAIIKIAQRLGFARTSIRRPSSANQDIYHEYWYYLPPAA